MVDSVTVHALKRSKEGVAKALDTAAARHRFASRAVRELSDARMKRAFAESLSRSGHTHDEISKLTGAKRSQVSRWANPNYPDLPNVSHVLCLPESMRAEMVRALATAAGFDCVPVMASAADALSSLAEIERESSEAKLVTLRAIADSEESDAELSDQVREHTEAGDAHYRRAARCRADLKARRASR
jgi:hypothetical protein